MVIRHRKMWLGLMILGIGWVLLRIFSPLPDPWDAIGTLVLSVLVLTYSCIVLWEERRERKAEQSA